jgi:hypothetical protein
VDDKSEDGLPPALDPGHPLFGLGYAEPVGARPLLRLQGDASQAGEAVVAEEVPIAFIYNGRPHLVMMGTPADLEDFAVGFSLTEEIVRDPGEITRLDVVRHAQGIELHLDIPDAAAERVTNRGRNLVGRTGCGLCGVESIQEAVRESRSVAPLGEIPWNRSGEPRPRCRPRNAGTRRPGRCTPRHGPAGRAFSRSFGRTWGATMRWTR